MNPSGTDGATSTAVLDLSDDQRRTIAKRKAACPFIASAIESGALSVRNSAERPLAAIADIIALGDSGGGNVGQTVLKLFARGNHSRLPDADGNFETPTPTGMFSLDLAGSQGAHPGHSGILLGNPRQLDAGRFNAADFERLAKRADERGLLTIAAIGAFIAENIERDPAAKVLPVSRWGRSLFGIVDELGDSLFALLGGRRTDRDAIELVEKLTKFAGDDNLIGSAGEFGLLFGFLAHRPGAEDETIRLADVEEMMVHHRFPVGWEAWPKQATDWVRATTKIAASAIKSHLKRS